MIRLIAVYISVLVVAPWISQRTQELLTAQDIDFLDLTGNASSRRRDRRQYVYDGR